MSVPAAYDLRKFTFSHATATRYVTTAADLLDAIDALHQPIDNPYDSTPNSLCGHCLHQWPCQTHRLLHPEEARRDR